eukprot:365099-Chlamydomonas_euryale.AAC.7
MRKHIDGSTNGRAHWRQYGCASTLTAAQTQRHVKVLWMGRRPFRSAMDGATSFSQCYGRSSAMDGATSFSHQWAAHAVLWVGGWLLEPVVCVRAFSSCRPHELIPWPEIGASAAECALGRQALREAVQSMLPWNLRSPDRLGV